MEKINYNIEDYILKENGKPTANWEKIASIRNKHIFNKLGRFERFYGELLTELKNEGILTKKWGKNSYSVVGAGVNGAHIGPNHHELGRFNFNGESEAKKYLKNANKGLCEGATLPAHIVQVIE
jgi:hypothetical protein